CSLTTLVGAFAAVEKDAFLATAASLALFAEAGTRTAQTAKGPGSFAWQFLDQLTTLQPEDISADRVVA
ncbi:MAG TPA: hydroxyethylthiazole kinase, partial [Rhizobiales bacterium]|nr:hydroxyethylthiazole kinase [Hyphomicrobiales bacterium]